MAREYGEESRRIYKDEHIGVRIGDMWSDTKMVLASGALERNGYPTQKPLAILDRIIQSSSNDGDVVLDPFCGSGTTIESAINNGRQYVGIDRNEDALIGYVQKRIDNATAQARIF